MFGMAFFKSLRVPRERSLSNSDCPRVGEKLTHCPIAETLPDFTSIQFTALAFLPTMRGFDRRPRGDARLVPGADAV